MITEHNNVTLSNVLAAIYPEGGWSAKDSEIVDIPSGREMPTLADLETALIAHHAAESAKAASATLANQKKTQLFLDLKSRLSTHLGIEITTPDDLAGRIEEIIPAAKTRREAKVSTDGRLAEMEKQVELLTMFVALMARN